MFTCAASVEEISAHTNGSMYSNFPTQSPEKKNAIHMNGTHMYSWIETYGVYAYYYDPHLTHDPLYYPKKKLTIL